MRGNQTGPVESWDVAEAQDRRNLTPPLWACVGRQDAQGDVWRPSCMAV